MASQLSLAFSGTSTIICQPLTTRAFYPCMVFYNPPTRIIFRCQHLSRQVLTTLRDKRQKSISLAISFTYIYILSLRLEIIYYCLTLTLKSLRLLPEQFFVGVAARDADTVNRPTLCHHVDARCCQYIQQRCQQL